MPWKCSPPAARVQRGAPGRAKFAAQPRGHWRFERPRQVLRGGGRPVEVRRGRAKMSIKCPVLRRGVLSFGFLRSPPARLPCCLVSGRLSRSARGRRHNFEGKARKQVRCGSIFTAFPGALRKVIAPSFPFRTAPVFRFGLFRFGGCSDLSLAVPPRISRRCLVNQPGILLPLSPSGGQHRLVPIFSVRSLSATVSRIRSSAPLKPHNRWLCAAHLGCPRISPQPWVVQRTPWFGAATYGLVGWPADNRG